MMYTLKLIALMLAVITIVFAELDDQKIVSINQEEGIGNYKLQVVKEGSVTTVTFQSEDIETVTEILTGEGYEAEKPSGSSDCNLKRLNETEDTYNKCSKKSQVTADEVPSTLVMFCGDRTLYVTESVPCERRSGRKKRATCVQYQYYTECQTKKRCVQWQALT